jgi:hypothetical protein
VDGVFSVVADVPADADEAHESPASDLRPEVADLAPADLPTDTPEVDFGPEVLGLDASTEVALPAFPSSYGGCARGVVTRSLAFYGTQGIDFDEDGISDDVDNCPVIANPEQNDSDQDGLGDACDRCDRGADGDGDGICDAVDNCPNDWNPSQDDSNGDGIGNRCDAQGCSPSDRIENLQRITDRIVREPDSAAALQGAHWRVLSWDTYCKSDNSLGMRVDVVDYRNRKQLSVSYLIATNTRGSYKIADLSDLQGPQPSAEEGREATYLAERDPRVRAALDSLTGLSSMGPFFYEFGPQAATNDPAFPTCATGRCIDILYSGYRLDAGYINYSVVVEMDACKVLGVRQR